MKRQRGTDLLASLLTNVEDGQRFWPLTIIKELYVFGSFARGAVDPHDVDVLVVYDRTDKQWASHFVHCISYGRNPYALLRKPLIGHSRSVQLVFDDPGDLHPLLLWRSGDQLATALARLHAIPTVEGAGRAPRDAMLPEFGGIDEKWLPRFFREGISAAVAAGAITLDRQTLPDNVSVRNPIARAYIEERWNENSPLRRAAQGVLAHFESRGIDVRGVHLHGQDVDVIETPYFAAFNLRYLRSLPRCLTRYAGREWVEVIHPTRRSPLEALRIAPADLERLEQLGSNWI